MPDTSPTPRRPHMPGYGLEVVTTPPGIVLPWSRVDQILRESRNYWVSTTRPDGRPHAMPVWGLWDGAHFLFSTGRESRKAKNLAANPAISVHCESGDIAIVVEGQTREVTDPAELKAFATAYEPKYDWTPAVEGESGGWEGFLVGSAVYEVTPTIALSFAEDLGETATRWEFDAS
jgi:hypothetical protein